MYTNPFASQATEYGPIGVAALGSSGMSFGMSVTLLEELLPGKAN